MATAVAARGSIGLQDLKGKHHAAVTVTGEYRNPVHKNEDSSNVKTAAMVDGRRQTGVTEYFIPTEPGWIRAIIELLITSEWLGLGFRTMRFPSLEDESLKDLYTGLQTNIALLGALMLAIVVPIMYDAAEKPGILGALYYILSWLATLLYFVSCTWAVFLLIGVSQTSSTAETTLFLQKMGSRNILPVRLWIYASLCVGVFIQLWFAIMALDRPAVLVVIYIISVTLILWLIVGVAGLVKNVYTSKIEMKHRELSELDPTAAVPATSKTTTFLCLPNEIIDAYIAEYAELFHSDRLNAETLQKYVLRTYPKGTMLTNASVARLEKAVEEWVESHNDAL